MRRSKKKIVADVLTLESPVQPSEQFPNQDSLVTIEPVEKLRPGSSQSPRRRITIAAKITPSTIIPTPPKSSDGEHQFNGPMVILTSRRTMPQTPAIIPQEPRFEPTVSLYQ